MESFSARNLIYATQRIFPSRYPLNPIRVRRSGAQIGNFCFVLYSKQSDLLDFRDFAKPSRLLPAANVDAFTDSLLEKLVTSSKVDDSGSLFKVKLCTSNMYGSGLSDINAGILLCLIDENGDSILQRIPAITMRDHSTQSEDQIVSDLFHFQSASVDEFNFKGPKLGKIEALWISLESGQWRLGDVSLTVVCQCQPPTDENHGLRIQYSAFQYDFEVRDILLGEGSDVSVAELRPCTITEFSADNFALLSKTLLHSSSPKNSGISNEESMKEYADLKFSLLFYDGLLILTGASVASFSAGENAALAFLTGGIGGFLYLLLLQRSVDGLSAPASTSNNRTGNFNQVLGRFKSPVSSLAFALSFAIIVIKYGSGDVGLSLTAKEVMFGMVGFLSCKAAVVLAAFRPMPLKSKGE